MMMTRYLQMLRKMDWLLFAVMVVLAAGSVLFIYSASYRGPGQPMPSFFRMQMIWFGIGLALYLGVALIDYRLICQWAVVWYVVATGLLVVVLVSGARVYGARRWLGVGSLGIQPAEIAKLAIIVAVSYYLYQKSQGSLRRWTAVAATGGMVSVPLVLIMLEPDLGSAMVLVPVAFCLLFVSGARVKHLALVAALGMALAPLAWLKLKDYQRDRLTVFLDPSHDPVGVGWNLNQSLIAVGSGGMLGKGYLQGTQNLLGFLPRTVAPNDFLFSVIAEEKGFVGSIVVLALYAGLLFRGLRIAAGARDRLGTLLAAGIVALLFCHIFINMGMTIGLMPVTGLPLPLLSYGGSFVLATMTALGLLQNIWIHRRAYE